MGKVACVGAGTVGRAWAVVFARAGHEVALYDAAPGRAEGEALPLVRRSLDQLGEVGWLVEPPALVAARVQSAATIAEAVADAVHVQESVPEDLELKRTVLAEVASYAPQDAILASSTSALKGSDFLGHVLRPQRALVAHPVNPPSIIPLVELCGSQWTDAATLAQTRDFLLSAGMKPVTLRREIDGFLLNRLQYTLVAEALHLVGEGYCSAADIDTVMTQGLALRWLSIGPFETAHLNAAGGFQAFVHQLGDMMRRIGRDARTDYDWTAALVDRIHDDLCRETPVDEIRRRQEWRDVRIIAARMLQAARPADAGP